MQPYWVELYFTEAALILACTAFIATAVLCSFFTQSLVCVNDERYQPSLPNWASSSENEDSTSASVLVCEEAVLCSLKFCTSVTVVFLLTALAFGPCLLIAHLICFKT